MKPIVFDEVNAVMKPPKEMDEEQCCDIPVHRGFDQNDIPVTISKWHPSKEDIEIINNGGGIFLVVAGERMPPVYLTIESPFEE